MHQTIPAIEPKALEEILEYLPEPASAEVALFGFDYSGLSKQAEEYIKGISLIAGVGTVSVPHFGLANPTKEKILEIYNKSYEIKQGPVEGMMKPRFDISKVTWERNNLELTPHNLSVSYPAGEEPGYISDIRKILPEGKLKVNEIPKHTGPVATIM